MIIYKEIVDNELISQLTYGGFEDDIFFGKCKVNLNGETADLELLEVIEKYRGNNLGEGLLRSTLNKLDKIGIKKVYYNCDNSYLIRKGFLKENDIIYVELPDFFNLGCSNRNKRNGEDDNEI